MKIILIFAILGLMLGLTSETINDLKHYSNLKCSGESMKGREVILENFLELENLTFFLNTKTNEVAAVTIKSYLNTDYQKIVNAIQNSKNKAKRIVDLSYEHKDKRLVFQLNLRSFTKYRIKYSKLEKDHVIRFLITINVSDILDDIFLEINFNLLKSSSVTNSEKLEEILKNLSQNGL